MILLFHSRRNMVSETISLLQASSSFTSTVSCCLVLFLLSTHGIVRSRVYISSLLEIHSTALPVRNHGNWTLEGLESDGTNASERPPISLLIDGENITGNVGFLLDFAIVGHAKCATTLFSNWLRSHPRIQMYHDEIHALTKLQPVNMVKLMYNLPPMGLHGYKAPRDIVDPLVVDMLTDIWPAVKLIVGLRHPIDWFESFYNYRVSQNPNVTMPPAESLIGKCLRDMTPPERKKARLRLNGTNDLAVCTHSARFHVHLSRLGKTNVTERREDELLGLRRIPLLSHAPLKNKIFLYDADQLSDSNETRSKLFKHDLEVFLGLDEPLGSPPSMTSPQANYNHNKKHPLNICKDQYTELRAELLRHGKAASTWIREFFMNLPDVTISSPTYFGELLQQWHTDPCDHEKPSD